MNKEQQILLALAADNEKTKERTDEELKRAARRSRRRALNAARIDSFTSRSPRMGWGL